MYSQILWAQGEVHIGLHMDKEVHRMEFVIDTGSYELWANGELVATLHPGNKFELVVYKTSLIRVITKDTIYDRNYMVMIKGVEDYSEFAFRMPEIDTLEYVYQGGLTLTSRSRNLWMINIIDIQKYLMGVVRAEIGDLSELEFLKAMAVVSRTYIMRNRRRHESDGFDLCDRTHCQVYSGNLRISAGIRNATISTKGLVVVDEKGRLINAVFHSNSGGQTVGSEYVWGGTCSYLKSKPDPYALRGRNYSWEFKIPVMKWKEYLSRKTKTKVSTYYCDTTFVRAKYYYSNNTRILLADIRKDLKLRSTYFTMETKGDTLVFNGRGYGHGVGLSQEGANRMAELKYSYKDIIKYYYQRVDIIDYANWQFQVH